MDISTKGFAIVTGAANGIGRETALAFARNRAFGVCFADIDEAAAQVAAQQSREVATAWGYRAIAIQVDVAQEPEVQVLIRKVIAEFGRLDYMINCAGIMHPPTPILDFSLASFERLQQVNVNGTFHCLRAAARVMRYQEPKLVKTRNHEERTIGRGVIINVSSVISGHGFPGLGAYTASKDAIMGLTRVAAAEEGAYGIRVNAVSPAFVRTRMLTDEYDKLPALENMMKRSTTVGRLSEPDEIADSILFLCSPASAYIAGHALVIDAALSATLRFG